MLFSKHTNGYYLKYGWLFLIGTISVILIDIVQLRIPRLIGQVVNGINTGTVETDGTVFVFDMDFLLRRICLPVIIVMLIMLGGRFLWRLCFSSVSVGVERDLRTRMFDRCRHLSQDYYSESKIGNLMSLFTNDIDTIQDCFGWGILMLCDVVFLGGIALYNMARMSLTLTLLSLIPMALMAGMAVILDKFMEKRWDERQAAFSHLSDFSQEMFTGIAVVKAFVKEAHELREFRKLNGKNEKANVAFTRLDMMFEVGLTLFIEAVICIVLGYGGYLVHLGVFNVGQLVEYLGYFDAVIWPCIAISELIGMTARGHASAKRVGALLTAKTSVADQPDAADFDTVRGDISFRHLTFTYPGAETPALVDVSFDIKAGENVGITGRTGAGKTTLVDLLLRVWNVPAGTLFLDGHDVTEMTIHSLRENAAYVPQDNFLFSDTIAHNIAFACDTEEPDAVERAARMAGVHDDVAEFHAGYATVLGERGVTVSGGQKQRISIARALMKNAPVLVLDDSVSAVDTDTERHILGELRRERLGKTTILIAHRISTVAGMDKIVYLDEGRVLDVGTHEELYARCASYRRAVDLQKLEEEREVESHV